MSIRKGLLSSFVLSLLLSCFIILLSWSVSKAQIPPLRGPGVPVPPYYCWDDERESVQRSILEFNATRVFTFITAAGDLGEVWLKNDLSAIDIVFTSPYGITCRVLGGADVEFLPLDGALRPGL